MLTVTDPRSGASTSLDYTWPPVPAVPATLFGSSVAKRAGETQAGAWSRLRAALAPQLTRVYDGGQGLGKALATARACGWPDVPSVLSCKYPLADYDTGRYDAEFVTAATQLSARDYLCIWHEQDAKIAQGQMTLSQFHDIWDYFVTLARTHAVKARFIQIFTGYDIGHRLEQYVGDSWCDAVGIDPYVHNSGETAQTKIAPILTAIRAVTAKPIAVCETGATFPAPTGYIKSLAVLRGQLAFCCWFSSVDTQTGIDYAIDADPASAAAYRSLAAA